MIRKLKRKIFWSIESSAMGVLLGILLFLNLFSALHTERENWQMMAAFLQPAGESSMDGPAHGKAAKTMRALMEQELCAVETDSTGAIVSVIGTSVVESDSELETLVGSILAGGRTRGRVGTIRYLVSQSSTGTFLVLSNSGGIDAGTLQTLLISLLGFMAAGLLFALLAQSLAKRIVRPVEETLQEQKRFIADASHELKTPVTVINANIAVLEKESGPNKWLTFIREEGERLSTLVSSMLEFARIDCAKDALGKAQQPVRFDAAAAMAEAALPFESVAFEAGINCQFALPQCAQAYGSAEDLKQIIGILLDNAIKHTEPQGTVCFTAENRKRRKKLWEESVLVLEVSNTGEEIPEKALPLLFQRFYQVDASRQHKKNSFGLGLAIAQSLAEKNRGEITVTSKNRRTVFTLAFPVR